MLTPAAVIIAVIVICIIFFLSFFFFAFAFLGPHPWRMKVPRLGVGSERPLPAYTTATAMQDPSRVCDPHHHSRHRQIPDPLGEARDSTYILADARGIPFRCATMGTPSIIFFISWMWKLRPREVMRLAQGHPAKKWCMLGSRPSPLSPKARAVSFAPHCAFKSRAS